MIPTLLRIALTNLRRDRVVQAMAFLMPVIFFSIFAGVFGSQGRDRTARVRVAVVDEDGSAASARLVTALKEENGLSTRTVAPPVGAAPKAAAVTLDRARALALVRAGDVPVAIVIPKGFGASFGSFDSSGRTVELLSDTSDPVAPQVVSGLLQKVAMTAAPDLLAKQGIGMFEKYAGGLTPEQKRVTESWFGMLDGKAPSDSAKTGTGPSAGGPAAGGAKMGGLINARIVDVLGEKKTNPIIAFYAAGIAVMFLLFSASGAGGALLDEVESGTLERLLTSSASMSTILAGKWVYVTLLGIFQITVMFVWGMVAFRLDLLHHLPGFSVMTLFTAMAAAGFGLVLATLCKSRQQLAGLSTILILTQSALGGSMFPRFLMSESMQKMGLFTFNAWALDGYIKVFWRDAPLTALWPQLAVLTALTAVFLIVARLLARRWETM
ncbi:MAG: ABC transporter permease [Candidatus Eisenbacteria bacterium]|uniref:ABC transporter permease n=1 Tax=Eiseniibacteriota bacterium TaxID=2212470 RepID=A0A538U3E6_UNCEI|nr:MAG: ABC transporter permease [Candidatus Eisenbacteria bacterium]